MAAGEAGSGVPASERYAVNASSGAVGLGWRVVVGVGVGNVLVSVADGLAVRVGVLVRCAVGLDVGAEVVTAVLVGRETEGEMVETSMGTAGGVCKQPVSRNKSSMAMKTGRIERGGLVFIQVPPRW